MMMPFKTLFAPCSHSSSLTSTPTTLPITHWLFLNSAVSFQFPNHTTDYSS